MGKGTPIFVALIYAVASFVVLSSAIAIDKFSIFSDWYINLAILAPTVLLPVVMIILQIRHRRWNWLALVAGCVMVVAISFGHLALVAAASASV